MFNRSLRCVLALTCLCSVAIAQGNSAAQPGAGTAPKPKDTKGKGGSAAGQPATNQAPQPTQPGSPGQSSSGQSSPPQSSPGGGDIQYLDLVAPDKDHPKPKLPYGRPFTISGKASEVCIKGKPNRNPTDPPCGAGGQRLVDLLAPTAVGGTYVVEGKETPFTPSDISGDAWTVTVGKLDENKAATIRLAFSGNLSIAQASGVMDALLTNKEFLSNLDSFTSAAQKDQTQFPGLATAFGQSTAAMVLDLMKARGIKPKDSADLGKRLLSPSAAIFRTFINLPAELRVLQGSNLTDEDRAKLGIDTKMSPGEVYEHVKEALSSDAVKADAALVIQVNRFIKNYDSQLKALATAVVAELTVEVGTTAVDITEDLQKYAGFDIGALYVPRLHELRTFVTVNIYFKAVSLNPSAGTRFPVWERLSLTFGMALKDFSGGDAAKAKIKDQNAFIYGAGIRLNKYFRISVGGLVYRAKLPGVNGIPSPIDNKLRHEVYIGPSIDITAIPALKGVFAKSQSN